MLLAKYKAEMRISLKDEAMTQFSKLQFFLESVDSQKYPIGLLT